MSVDPNKLRVSLWTQRERELSQAQSIDMEIEELERQLQSLRAKARSHRQVASDLEVSAIFIAANQKDKS